MAIMKHTVSGILSNEPYFWDDVWWVDVLAWAEEPDVGNHFVVGSTTFATLEEALAITVGYVYYMNWEQRSGPEE